MGAIMRRAFRKEVKELTSEVTGLRKENARLRENVCNLKQKTSSLAEDNTGLKAENPLKRNQEPSRAYIIRYRLDLEVTPIATEIRIYADRDGTFQVPDELKADVSYGGTVKAIAAFLYSEGVVANDRICTFINSFSGDKLHLSTGNVYGFCQRFAQPCSTARATSRY